MKPDITESRTRDDPPTDIVFKPEDDGEEDEDMDDEEESDVDEESTVYDDAVVFTLDTDEDCVMTDG